MAVQTAQYVVQPGTPPVLLASEKQKVVLVGSGWVGGSTVTQSTGLNIQQSQLQGPVYFDLQRGDFLFGVAGAGSPAVFEVLTYG